MQGADEWDHVAGLVSQHDAELKECATPREFFQWAQDHKLATKTKFPKFKTELRKQLGVDYDELREKTRAEANERAQREVAELTEKAEDGPRIILTAAGDAEVNSYAVCYGGKVAWYGEFFPDDKGYSQGDQTSADTEAMKKAVWLAAKAKEELGLDTLMLELHILNHEVPTPTRACAKAGLGLDFHIDDTAEIALEWARENGFQSWREVALKDLLAAK